MKAWALLVVSSEGQAGTLTDQRQWAETACAEHAWALERCFEDVSTGKRGVRNLLTTMITALRLAPPHERPDWVLMIRADRVGRGRIADSQIALHEIVDLGCRIWTRNEGEVKLDTAMDQLISAARQATAAFENEVRAEKAKAYYDKRRGENAPSVTNKRPYGLRVVAGGNLEPVPGEAEIVRKIFEMRIAGSGATTIGRVIYGVAPVPVKANGKPRKTAPRWMPYTITRMIRNRKYCGTVVDEMTWHRAQLAPAHVATRAWNTAAVYPWPLGGTIRCFCGAGMYGQPGGHAPRKTRYYLCSQPFRHPEGRKLVRAERLEEQFVALLDALIANPDAVRRLPVASTDMLDRALRVAQAELTALARQREAVWEMQAAGVVRAEDVQERLDTLARKRDEVSRRVLSLTAERSAAVIADQGAMLAQEIISRGRERWDVAQTPEQRIIVRAVSGFAGGLWCDREAVLQSGPVPRMIVNALG